MQVFPRSSRGQHKKDGITGMFLLTCNASYSKLQIKTKNKTHADIREDGSVKMSPFVFVPIAADFQRRILETSTKEAKGKEN